MEERRHQNLLASGPCLCTSQPMTFLFSLGDTPNSPFKAPFNFESTAAPCAPCLCPSSSTSRGLGSCQMLSFVPGTWPMATPLFLPTCTKRFKPRDLYFDISRLRGGFGSSCHLTIAALSESSMTLMIPPSCTDHFLFYTSLTNTSPRSFR